MKPEHQCWVRILLVGVSLVVVIIRVWQVLVDGLTSHWSFLTRVTHLRVDGLFEAIASVVGIGSEFESILLLHVLPDMFELHPCWFRVVLEISEW